MAPSEDEVRKVINHAWDEVYDELQGYVTTYDYSLLLDTAVKAVVKLWRSGGEVESASD